MVIGLPKLQVEDIHCEVCVMGIGTKVNTLRGTQNSSMKYTPGEYLHSDIFGPVRGKADKGEQYMVTFLYNASDYAFIYLLQRKSQAKECF
jgi:copper chaperone CopZ